MQLGLGSLRLKRLRQNPPRVPYSLKFTNASKDFTRARTPHQQSCDRSPSNLFGIVIALSTGLGLVGVPIPLSGVIHYLLLLDYSVFSPPLDCLSIKSFFSLSEIDILILGCWNHLTIIGSFYHQEAWAQCL